MSKIKDIYIVTKPTEYSEFADVYFKTDIEGLRFQFLGGLKFEEIVGVFTEKKEAVLLAKKLLKKRGTRK